MIKYTLSKTGYISYLACPEEYWMSLHQRELMPAFSVDAQHKVEQGKLIDRLAQDWFRSGLVLNEETIDPELIDFQKTAKWGDFIAIADVVVTVDDMVVDIYEVKASTRVDGGHIHDVAFQRFVFEKAGYQVRKCFLVHVDKDYVLDGEVDLNQLMVADDITEKVEEILDDTGIQALAALQFINRPLDSETLTLGCGGKGNCLYLQQYHGPWPEYSIFDISRIGIKKLQTLLDQNIRDIKDVPEDFKLSAKMREQVDVAQEDKIFIRESAIQNILDDLEYPLYFLDYETFSYVLPAQNGIRPYQQMVFQYSLHVITEPGAETVHHEYLLSAKDEPVENLIAHMKERINPKQGTALVWNQGFEKGRNREMANDYPQHADFLLGLNEMVYDLMEIFSKGLYQHPKFKGKSSIKKVLPVLCPELSYGDLEIQNGNAAVIQWHHATDGRLSAKEQQNTFKNLLAYCHLDTLAMVRIWEVLKNEAT